MHGLIDLKFGGFGKFWGFRVGCSIWNLVEFGGPMGLKDKETYVQKYWDMNV